MKNTKTLFASVLAVSFLMVPLQAFALDSAPATTTPATTSSATSPSNAAQTPSGDIKAVTGFSDVLRTHDSYVAITYLNENNIIAGYSDGTFKPENPINRAEALKVIFQGAGVTIPDQVTQAVFPDVPKDAWFAKFVLQAKTMAIVAGNTKDGTFTPARQVNKAEFLKMLLMANGIKSEALTVTDAVANDVPKDAWFAPYMSYAVKAGIITKDDKGNLEPNQPLTRAQVADMMYLLILIKDSKDTQFLLHRAEAELAQIEVYIAANKVANAKRSSELAVDLTQQALKNMPDNNVVLGAAKLAKAYDLLVQSFILGIQKNNTEAATVANQAIDKATEAWQANNATQPIAKHIKDRANEILAQVGGKVETPAPATTK
jgi:S-layer homology domain